MRITTAITILGVGVAAVAGIGASAQAQQDRSRGEVCTVQLERTQPPGVLDVTRQVFDDGSCNCFIYTGPETQPANVEAQVNNVLRTQSCPGARPMRVNGPGQGASAGAGQIASVRSLMPVFLFAGAAAGVVFVVDGDEGSSP